VTEAYDQYQFHMVFYTLYNFCTVDLSALYLDVLKDRLYTSKAQSEKRRSAQSAMYIILDAMTRLLAPILTFTAEEIWSSLPTYGGKEISVHLTRFPAANPEWMDADLAERWKTMVALKGEVSKAVEIARQKKVIGHTLDARVNISPSEKLVNLLDAHLEDMRTLLIVSQVNIVPKDSLTDPYVSGEFEGLTIGVTRSPGEKCNRCWIFSESVGADKHHATICTRCCGNLE
jgi:isoleucyl-tRNA synthetase